MCENLTIDILVKFTYFLGNNRKETKRSPYEHRHWCERPCGSESVPNVPLYPALERQVPTTLYYDI